MVFEIRYASEFVMVSVMASGSAYVSEFDLAFHLESGL